MSFTAFYILFIAFVFVFVAVLLLAVVSLLKEQVFPALHRRFR